jgi:acyl carrier protein
MNEVPSNPVPPTKRELINEKVINAVVETAGVERNKVTLDKDLIADLNLDSLDLVEITLRLEEDFGVEIPDDRVMEFKTLNDIINWLEKHIK